MSDEALLLGPERSNVGVFTTGSDLSVNKSKTAVIFITAGLLHHVGPHRLHVLLARRLATKGISSLRIDLSGIGDSLPRSDDLAAEEIAVQEINDAIHLLESRGFTRFILFGICSGAVQAIKVAANNSKIAGIVLINTGSDDGNTEANTEAALQFYLQRSILNINAWKNLFTGKVNYTALFVTLFSAIKQKISSSSSKAKKRSFEDELQQMTSSYQQQDTAILMIMSDRHAQYYSLYKTVFDKAENDHFKALFYPKTDHLFTSLSAQKDLIDEVCQWSDVLAEKNL